MIERKHVAIGIVSTGLWHSEMGASLAQLTMASIFRCDLTVLDGKHGSSTSDGRNRLVLGAQAVKADYLLQIDSDMVFPANALMRLLDQNKEMIGATYPRRAPPYDVFNRLPTGFLLCNMSVFDKISAPWFYEEIDWEGRNSNNIAGTITEDMVFNRRVTEAGIEPIIDTALSYDMVHIGKQFVQAAPMKKEAA